MTCPINLRPVKSTDIRVIRARRKAYIDNWREKTGYKSERDLLRYEGIPKHNQFSIRTRAQRALMRSVRMCEAASLVWLLDRGYPANKHLRNAQGISAARAAADLAECQTCGREMPSGRCVICDEPAPDEGQ